MDPFGAKIAVEMRGLISEIRDLISVQNKQVDDLISRLISDPNKLIPDQNKQASDFERVSPHTPLQKERESSINQEVLNTSGDGKDLDLQTPIEISPFAKKPNKNNGAINKAMFALISNWWNNEVAPLLNVPCLIRWTKNRQQAITARLKENPNLLQDVLQEARRIGPFARQKRFMTIDWILSPSNLQKLLEGNYRALEAIHAENKASPEQLERAYEESRSQASPDLPDEETGGVQGDLLDGEDGDPRAGGDPA